MEIVIAAKSGERCHMPLHAFTVFCYVPSLYYFVIKQKGESNKYTFLNFGIW